jgi:hypothetical protein
MPATSQSQQRLFGLLRAYQKGKAPHASPQIKEMAKTITPKVAREFAATPHAGLPEKKENAAEKLAAEIEKSAAFLGGVYTSVMDADPIDRCASVRGAHRWFLNGGMDKAAASIKPMQPIQAAQFNPPMGTQPQQQQQGSLLPNAAPAANQVPVPQTPPVGRYDFRNDPAVLGMQARVRESVEKKLAEAEKLRYQAAPQAQQPQQSGQPQPMQPSQPQQPATR